MVGINVDYDYLFDPQQTRPACLCQNCGAEIYREGQDICEECMNSEEM